MRRLILGGMLAAVLMIAANGALAFTASELNEGAEALQRGKENRATRDDQVSMSQFIGYVQGATDVMYVQKLFCPPQGTNKGQYAAVIHKFLKEHPERWHEDAVQVVGDAMIQTFPCK